MHFLHEHGEALMAAALMLISAYAAVYFIRHGQYGNAGYAVFAAYGFAHALTSFIDASDLRARMRRVRGDQVTHDPEGA